jgi:hypothetical protein
MSITKREWAEVVRKSQEPNLEVRDSEDHRRTLETVIRQHGRERAELVIVDDIAEWCVTHSVPMLGNPPPAMAVVEQPSGRWMILLRRRIDSDGVQDVLFSTLTSRGFLKAGIWLDTTERFLEHLVLHELAHLNNNWGQDRDPDCDAWAFEKMGLIAK